MGLKNNSPLQHVVHEREQRIVQSILELKQLGFSNQKIADALHTIGEQLLKLRLQADMTQAEVAKKVGTTASAISRYENAEYDRYELQTLRKIVEACGGVLRVTVNSLDEEEAA